MQNCNIPPDAMMPDSPFSLAATKPYIYADLSHGGQRDGWSNQRGARAVEYLNADESVTIEEALGYATDVHLFGSERWLSVLRKADERFGTEIRAEADVSGALDELLAWDSELRPDSKGALKYYYWRRQMVEDHGADTMRDAARRIDNYRESLGEAKPLPELSDDELRGALTSFANAVKTMKEHFGTLDKVYGDVFRVGRDEKSWPLGGGGDGHLGMTTFRNVGYGNEKPDHTRWGRSGQTSTEIIVLTDPIQSWTYVPIGQSDRPESPHYNDQAEKAFSSARLKPTWWRPEELKDHIESRAVLEKRID
jgi:acyl-homoserine lactone acylase PvdQ